MALKPMPAAQLRNLQAFLRRSGFNLGTAGPLSDGVDGDWGPATEKAFLAWIDQGQPAAAPPAAAVGPRPIPPAYDWLNRMPVDQMPRTIWCALQELGVKELSGGPSSPTIMSWAAEVGLEAIYTADSIPWCGLFAAVIVKRAKKPVVKDPLWALNWNKFGAPVGQPGLGDILTFTRTGGGHVGFYVGEDKTHYHVLGGNTSDQVMIARIEKKRLSQARRPIYTNLPPAVRPYILAAPGVTSTNEA